MNIKKSLKHFIIFALVTYTILLMVFIILAPGAIFHKYPTLTLFLLLFALSVVFALGSTVGKLENIPKIIGRIIHAVCFIGGFFGFLIIGGLKLFASVFVTAVFAFIYTIVFIIKAIVKKRRPSSSPSSAKKKNSASKKSKSKEKYQNQFSFKR